MNKVIKKAFYKPAWAIACRKIERDQTIFPNKSQTPFDVLLPKINEWYADSICFSENGRVFIFMEVMGRNGSNGTIGVTEYLDNKFSKVKDALIEPFHLSYPNVFKHKGHYYMIPETCSANELRIYESLDFPVGWKLKKVLLKDIQVVDTSFMIIDDDHYLLFSHDISENNPKLRLFILNLDNLVVFELKSENALSTDRPGGNIVELSDEKFRILQDCSESYGKQLKVFQIRNIDFNNESFEEEFIKTISIDDVPFHQKKKFDRIHTLTRSGEFEAIDTQYSKFFPNKPLQKIARKIKELI